MSELLPPPRIDACVFPSVAAGDDIRKYLPRPWAEHPFMGPGDFDYVTAVAPYADESPGSGLPGSDLARLLDRTLAATGFDRAVLVPQTRGVIPNVELGAAICTATNDWLAQDWLARSPALLGTIRVDPREPDLAIAEIERWAGDERFVQVGVTTQAHAPYGQRRYERVWAAVAASGRPLVICADGGSNSVQLSTTLIGTPRYQIQKAVLAPANFAFHLGSFLAEGTFERHPELVVVFADGGHDMLMPLMWRFGNDWRPQHSEVPWLKHAPLTYLADHVRFVTDPFAGADDMAAWTYWLELSDAARLLMYGSRYPHWDHRLPADVRLGAGEGLPAAVFGGTAARLYHLLEREVSTS